MMSVKHSHPIPVILDHILHKVVHDVEERSHSSESCRETNSGDNYFFQSLEDDMMKFGKSDLFQKLESTDLLKNLDKSDLLNFGTTQFDSSLLFELSQSFDDKSSQGQQHWNTFNSFEGDISCSECSKKTRDSTESEEEEEEEESDHVEEGDSDDVEASFVVGSDRIAALMENVAKLDRILDEYNLDELTEIEKLEDPIKASAEFRSSTPLDTSLTETEKDPWPIASTTTSPRRSYHLQTDTGLVNLDLIHPCTTSEPCLLDRMIIEEFISKCRTLKSKKNKKKGRFGFSPILPSNISKSRLKPFLIN